MNKCIVDQRTGEIVCGPMFRIMGYRGADPKQYGCVHSDEYNGLVCGDYIGEEYGYTDIRRESRSYNRASAVSAYSEGFGPAVAPSSGERPWTREDYYIIGGPIVLFLIGYRPVASR